MNAINKKPFLIASSANNLKMKKILTSILFALPLSTLAADTLDKVESEVFKKDGAPQQITSKAKSCIAEIIKPGEKGNAQSNNLFILVEENKIIANSQFEYVYMLIRRSAKSKLIFEARDGRFKITHTEIGYKQVDTAALAWGPSLNENESHRPLIKAWGTGWEEFEKQLQEVSKKIADCVINDKKQDW